MTPAETAIAGGAAFLLVLALAYSITYGVQQRRTARGRATRRLRNESRRQRHAAAQKRVKFQ